MPASRWWILGPGADHAGRGLHGRTGGLAGSARRRAGGWRDRPVVLVLAGTPDLVDSLKSCGATFASRGQMMPIGNLEAEAVQSVIREPLLASGMTVDDETIRTLAPGADHYPWFLQLYGHEAYQAVDRLGSNHLGMEECRIALECARIPREDYYDLMKDELEDEKGGWAMARAIARQFLQGPGFMTNRELDQAMAAVEPNRHRARI